MTDRLRVLCLDIDGGYGGSARSLFESIRHLDRTRVDVEVWCRRSGPARPRYQELGVPTRVTPAMPAFSALPRRSRNLYAGAAAAWKFVRSGTFRNDLLRQADARFDVIHFNHEGLFVLARWLRRRTRRRLTMHIRTNCWTYDNEVARWQARTISHTTDSRVFITGNERKNFVAAGGAPDGAVIYNISNPRKIERASKAPDAPIKIASISNYAWVRGTDRLVDIACALAMRGRRDIRFEVAGTMALTGNLPGPLGAIAKRGGSLADYAEDRGVADMFDFHGHVDDPEQVLAACDLLVKPTREANPWGRDIIESLALGRPVLAVGTDSTFVETGQTGRLFEHYDDEAFAEAIIELAEAPDTLACWGARGRARVADLCNGPARAADLLAVWQDVAGR